MPRKRIVSRTVEGTLVNFIAFNKVDNATYTDSMHLYGKYTSASKALKALKSVFDDTDRVALYITSSEPFYKRFGMDESKFLDMAEELPLLPSSTTEEEI